MAGDMPGRQTVRDAKAERRGEEGCSEEGEMDPRGLSGTWVKEESRSSVAWSSVGDARVGRGLGRSRRWWRWE